MTAEDRKEMKDAGSLKVKSGFKKALTIHRCYNSSAKSRFETIAMPMICSLVEHGFGGKMSYSLFQKCYIT